MTEHAGETTPNVMQRLVPSARWEDAKEQYRTDRDPKELLFARRTLAHFAVYQDLVFVTTRLAGKKTRFLPFNVGDGGPDNKDRGRGALLPVG